MTVAPLLHFGDHGLQQCETNKQTNKQKVFIGLWEKNRLDEIKRTYTLYIPRA
jgi:hypothetical protein